MNAYFIISRLRKIQHKLVHAFSFSSLLFVRGCNIKSYPKSLHKTIVMKSGLGSWNKSVNILNEIYIFTSLLSVLVCSCKILCIFKQESEFCVYSEVNIFYWCLYSQRIFFFIPVNLIFLIKFEKNIVKWLFDYLTLIRIIQLL